jgi:hypothetical protein
MANFKKEIKKIKNKMIKKRNKIDHGLAGKKLLEKL